MLLLQGVTGMNSFLLAFLALAIIVVFAGVKSVPQGREWTVERFGRFTTVLKPGLNLIVPFIDRIGRKLSMMEEVLEIPSQVVITRDNATVTADAIAFYQVVDAAKAAYEVANLQAGITNLCLTNARTVIGAMDLDEVLSKRDEINQRLLSVVDQATHPWGVKVTRIEIKDLSPPVDITEAMARQMKAERFRRAEVTQADGEKQGAILRAEGAKQSAILQAEGRKEAAFRDAEARERLAQAEAAATEMVSNAIEEGNVNALNYFLGQKYIEAFSQLATGPNQKFVILPMESAGLLGSIAGIAEMTKEAVTQQVAQIGIERTLHRQRAGVRRAGEADRRAARPQRQHDRRRLSRRNRRQLVEVQRQGDRLAVHLCRRRQVQRPRRVGQGQAGVDAVHRLARARRIVDPGDRPAGDRRAVDRHGGQASPACGRRGARGRGAAADLPVAVAVLAAFQHDLRRDQVHPRHLHRARQQRDRVHPHRQPLGRQHRARFRPGRIGDLHGSGADAQFGPERRVHPARNDHLPPGCRREPRGRNRRDPVGRDQQQRRHRHHDKGRDQGDKTDEPAHGASSRQGDRGKSAPESRFAQPPGRAGRGIPPAPMKTPAPGQARGAGSAGVGRPQKVRFHPTVMANWCIDSFTVPGVGPIGVISLPVTLLVGTYSSEKSSVSRVFIFQLPPALR